MIYTFTLRLWHIGITPQMLQPEIFYNRVFTAIAGFLSVIILIPFASYLFQSRRTALFSAWMYASLPRTIEQSRVSSSILHIQLFILVFFLVMTKIRNNVVRIFLSLLFTFVLFILLSNFSLPRILPLNNYISNFMDIVSFDLLFFHDKSIWYSEFKEFGLLYMTLLPFFFIGILDCIAYRKKIILLMLPFIFIAIINPYFPLQKEVLLLLPFFSIIAAHGMNNYPLTNIIFRFFMVIMILLVGYETAQFLHHYIIHYPVQLQNNYANIYEIF